MSVFIEGLLLGFSLILAIGAQNAFILKQGLKRQYVFILCSICAFSDAILIGAGVYGFSWLAKIDFILPIARFGGAAFLFVYGAKSLFAALKKNSALIAKENEISLRSAIILVVAFTWLNPHVYLDTVFLLGSISTQFPTQKLEFASGAMASSFIFFFSLGYGARFLAPLFVRPITWRILDFLIALVMWFIALKLLF